MGFIGSLAVFMILLGIVVVVHELGHLLIARWNGVFCEAFSFGFGPVLCSRKDSKGTEWRLSLIPLGGYVKMLGDADATSVKEATPDGYSEEELNQKSYHRKKPWQRLMIAFGGPLANFIFSIFVIFVISSFHGIPEHGNSITVASEDSVAYAAGLKTGDIITKANGKDVIKFMDLKEQITASSGKTLNLEIERDGTKQEITIEMFKKEGEETKPITILGVAPKDMIYQKLGVGEAVMASVLMTYRIAADNMQAIFKIVTGQMSTKNVGGIISIFNVASESAESGLIGFIMMIAMISAILGAVNLLPVPVLDGGTVVVSAIEWMIGRPLNKKFVETIFTVGLVFVAGLMLLGLWNDISNTKLYKLVESLFK